MYAIRSYYVLYEITSGTSNAKADITVEIEGNIAQMEEVQSGTVVRHSINLPEGWQACDMVSFSVLQEALGSPIEFNDSYSLIGVCPSGCDESFNYDENEDGSYTFTYLSSEDLYDAEIKFTCPHIKGFETQDGKEYSVNPGNSRNNFV